MAKSGGKRGTSGPGVVAEAAPAPLHASAQMLENFQKYEITIFSGEDEFAPGNQVPVTGVYTVIHDKLDGDDHAPPHQIIATAGTVFPQCRGCGMWVRFRHQKPAEPIEANEHFKTS